MSGNEFFNALLSSKFEIAPALAKFNFDFALFKIEAPPEYKDVGAALSQKRREDAEDGRTHITARKLGALFEEIIPETPALFRVYGQRASEIMRSASPNDQARRNYGAFTNSVGVDATSLWAAATSGKGAIAVHLLACMLARAWDGPAATSIWVEIVKERQSMIFAKFDADNQGHVASLMAAKQEITREQLREWDSSARAWLFAADSAKAASQKQLMLIINNLDVPVNQKPDVYDSVIEALNSALDQIEHLVKGTGQTARSGSTLLALSAWHIYPNMSVLKPVVTDVLLHDPLIPSIGVLTLGMNSPSQMTQTNGIHWSLPLSHLRRYGKPVQSSSSVTIADRARLTLNEFMIVFLGCFLASWEVSAKDRDETIGWLIWLSHLLENAASSESDYAKAMLTSVNNVSWLSLIFDAAKRYEKLDPAERGFSSKLLFLGEKYGQNFLGIASQPLFGLAYNARFIGCLEGEEQRIAYLRNHAQELSKEYNLSPHSFLIRYVTDTTIEFTSAIPCVNTRKRHSHGQLVQTHSRYINSHYGQRLASDAYINWVNLMLSSRGQKPLSTYLYKYHQNEQCESRMQELIATGDIVTILSENFIDDLHPNIGLGVHHDLKGEFPCHQATGFTPYELIHGDESTAALYYQATEFSHKPILKLAFMSANHPATLSRTVLSLARKGKFSTSRLLSELYLYFAGAPLSSDSYLQSLCVVSTMARLYENMPNATVDVRVLQQKLQHVIQLASTESFSSTTPRKVRGLFSPHIRVPDSLQSCVLSRKVAFSYILMFETGVYIIDKRDLRNVFAVSTTSSLFVGSTLLKDPWVRNSFDLIRHVPGNIGRSGISLLIPPGDPMIKEYDISDWRESGGLDITRIGRDCFAHTTLHLSFTGVEQPVNVGFTGGYDPEVYMLETLVGVFDRGKWIADLDVYRALSLEISERISLKAVKYLPYCERHGDMEADDIDHQVISLDTWTSILDVTQSHLNVVCARGNWQARLAATVVCRKLGYITWVAPDEHDTCWRCIEEEVSEIFGQREKKVIIID